MAYGVKRGVKTPGDFNTADIAGLALASSAGIVSALVVDYNQKGEASAIYTINQWAVQLSRLLSLGDIPLWAVVLTIIGVGAASIFYFQPITRQGAYAQGFGLLAVLMTAVPADLAGGLEAMTTRSLAPLPAPASPDAATAPGTPSDAPVAPTPDGGVVRANFSPATEPAPLPSAGDVDDRQGALYDVTLTITFPNGLPDDVESMIRKGTLRGRLHNQESGDTFNLFRTAGGTVQQRGNALVVLAGVPATKNSATLWVRIEAERYKIDVRSTTATVGQKVDWRIVMEPSNTPLFVQRLNNSYWF
ncbi:MAG: hypothetical protein K2Q06_14895 [Parvularculaceae bacterium]|nr:hypothetical protein [Parvularculaceae bacterium]